jgi:hypothetical protein
VLGDLLPEFFINYKYEILKKLKLKITRAWEPKTLSNNSHYLVFKPAILFDATSTRYLSSEEYNQFF